jgi:hypothetical protein
VKPPLPPPSPTSRPAANANAGVTKNKVFAESLIILFFRNLCDYKNEASQDMQIHWVRFPKKESQSVFVST